MEYSSLARETSSGGVAIEPTIYVARPLATRRAGVGDNQALIAYEYDAVTHLIDVFQDVGTHEELLKTSNIYREVYESQMKGGEEDHE